MSLKKIATVKLQRNSILLSLENLPATITNRILINSINKIVVDPISFTPLKYTQTMNDYFIVERIATPDEFKNSGIDFDQANFDINSFVAADPSRFILSNPIHPRHVEFLDPIKNDLNNLSSVWSGTAGSYIALYDLFNSIDYPTYPNLNVKDKDAIKSLILNNYLQIKSNKTAFKMLKIESDNIDEALDSLLNDPSINTEKLINRLSFVLNTAGLTDIAIEMKLIFDTHINSWMLDSINQDRELVLDTILTQLSPILIKKQLGILKA